MIVEARPRPEPRKRRSAKVSPPVASTGCARTPSPYRRECSYQLLDRAAAERCGALMGGDPDLVRLEKHRARVYRVLWSLSDVAGGELRKPVRPPAPPPAQRTGVVRTRRGSGPGPPRRRPGPRVANHRLRHMQIGNARVSKTDGSQCGPASATPCGPRASTTRSTSTTTSPPAYATTGRDSTGPAGTRRPGGCRSASSRRLAEFERELIRERTVAGLKAARARGRKGGRKFATRVGEVDGPERRDLQWADTPERTEGAV